MKFEEEQQILQKLINKLCVLSLQNQQSQSIREIGVEPNSESINQAITVRSVLLETRERLKKDIISLMGNMSEIIKADGDIKGSSYYKPLHERNGIVTNRNGKKCLVCNKSLVSKTSKAKFCSNKCKASHHRQKVKLES